MRFRRRLLRSGRSVVHEEIIVPLTDRRLFSLPHTVFALRPSHHEKAVHLLIN